MILPPLILVFLPVDWPIFSRRPMLVALAENAAQYGSKVVAINRPLCPFSTLVRKPHRAWELIWKPGLSKVTDHLYLYSPKYFLHDSLAGRLSLAEALNVSALRRSLHSLMRRLGVDGFGPIVWYYHPQQASVMRLYKESFKVFELYDNLTDVSGVADNVVLAKEARWRSTVDLLLATSPALLERYGPGYRRSRLLKNGLSWAAYRALSARTRDDDDVMRDIPRPRLGYAGVISERLNWELIMQLSAARLDWNFIFAGRVTHQRFIDLMSSRANVHYIGAHSQDRVPEIVRQFDIGILPYLDNDFFRFLNPLKVYENCAAGLTSVASPIEILSDFPKGIVTVCKNNVSDWITAIEATLRNRVPKTEEICRDFARQHVWEDITTDLLTYLTTQFEVLSRHGAERQEGAQH